MLSIVFKLCTADTDSEFHSLIVHGKNENLNRLVLVLYGVSDSACRCLVVRDASDVT